MNKLSKIIAALAVAGTASLALAEGATAPASSSNPYAFSYPEYQSYSGTGGVWKASPVFKSRADDPPAGGESYADLQAASSESPVWQPGQSAPSKVAGDAVPTGGPSYATLQAESSESPVWQLPQNGAASAATSVAASKVTPAPALRSLENHVATFLKSSPAQTTN